MKRKNLKLDVIGSLQYFLGVNFEDTGEGYHMKQTQLIKQILKELNLNHDKYIPVEKPTSLWISQVLHQYKTTPE